MKIRFVAVVAAALATSVAANAQTVVRLQEPVPAAIAPDKTHQMPATEAGGRPPGQQPAMAGEHESPPVYYFIRVNNLDYGLARRGPQASWDVNARIGTDDYRLVLKSEGEAVRGRTKDAEVQLLFDMPISEFFNVQAGWRRVLAPVNRNFFAIGIEGLAPYFFDTEATIFISEKGGASLRVKSGIDIPVAANLYTKPSIEANLYGSDDRALGTYAGFGSVKLALQTRYEITRQFAPYMEMGWERLLGRTGAVARSTGDRFENAYAVVGIRMWY
jgi:copper resistance protein B